VPAGLDAAQVRFDHQKGMREAAEHLITLGHEHVALIVGGPRLPARERRLGVESVFERAGGSVMVLEGPFTIQHGVDATERALRSQPRPTALVAAGNVLMHGALRALRARGVTAGRDLSLIGCDDVAVAEFHEPPIAAIRRDMPRIGELAAELLLSRLGEGPAPDSLVLTTDFVPAPSCTPVRQSNG
jgi:LacI family transcriptional regulator